MNVCIVFGPGAAINVVERAERALNERGVESWRADRDASAAAHSARLQKTDLILTLGGGGTFLAGGRLAAPRGVPLPGVDLRRPRLLPEPGEGAPANRVPPVLRGPNR